MVTVICPFAYSFKIMRIPQPIIPVRAPLQPVTVLQSGSANVIEVPYIHCLHGQVPKAFELRDLAEDRVRKVHPYTRVNAPVICNHGKLRGRARARGAGLERLRTTAIFRLRARCEQPTNMA